MVDISESSSVQLALEWAHPGIKTNRGGLQSVAADIFKTSVLGEASAFVMARVLCTYGACMELKRSHARRPANPLYGSR